jgi:phage pi2 protein 07
MRPSTALLSLGMKIEWKLSDFSAEKWKRNENMETEMEFCKTEMETVFLVEVETETEQHFPAEQTRKWNFLFRLMWNFCFTVILHGQSSRPNTGPCQTKPPKEPLIYSLLH